MARFDLTDFEWSLIRSLLPAKMRGVLHDGDCRVLNGIFWRLRIGAPRADIPARRGARKRPAPTAQQAAKADHLARIPAFVSGPCDEDEQMVDSPPIRARQYAVNGRKGAIYLTSLVYIRASVVVGGICHCVQSGAHLALCSTDQASTLSFQAKPEAMRRAFSRSRRS